MRRHERVTTTTTCMELVFQLKEEKKTFFFQFSVEVVHSVYATGFCRLLKRLKSCIAIGEAQISIRKKQQTNKKNNFMYL